MEEQRTILQTRLQERMDDTGEKAAPLAKRIGLSDSFIRDVLRGKTKTPSATNLELVARALGTSSDYLLGLTDQVRPMGPGIEVRHGTITYGGEVNAGAWLAVDGYFNQDEEVRIPEFVTPHPKYSKASQFVWRVVGNSMDLADIKDGMWVVGVAYGDYIDHYGDVESDQYVIAERLRAGGMERELTVKQVKFYRDRMELVPRSSNPTFEPIIVLHDNQADPATLTVSIVAVVVAAYRDFSL